MLLDAATDAGLLAALPGTAAAVAGAAGTDERATRIILDALVAFDVVTRDADGSYAVGAGAPDEGGAAVLYQHAGVIARWSTVLGDRLRGAEPEERGDRGSGEVGRWLDSLGARSRRPRLRCRHGSA